MIIDRGYEKILEQAFSQKKTIKKTIRYFQQYKDHKTLTRLFHHYHEVIFKEIDCLKCSNCCNTISPALSDRDIHRISGFYDMKPSAITSKYFHLDDEDDYVFNETPCPFLKGDNYCEIYPVRPKACREYPHTDHKQVKTILDIIQKNVFICPAVYLVINLVYKELS